MTDEEVLAQYTELVAMFGEKKIPDPECEPMRFAYYIKMFKYYKGIENDSQETATS